MATLANLLAPFVHRCRTAIWWVNSLFSRCFNLGLCIFMPACVPHVLSTLAACVQL